MSWRGRLLPIIEISHSHAVSPRGASVQESDGWNCWCSSRWSNQTIHSPHRVQNVVGGWRRGNRILPEAWDGEDGGVRIGRSTWGYAPISTWRDLHIPRFLATSWCSLLGFPRLELDGGLESSSHYLTPRLSFHLSIFGKTLKKRATSIRLCLQNALPTRNSKILDRYRNTWWREIKAQKAER